MGVGKEREEILWGNYGRDAIIHESSPMFTFREIFSSTTNKKLKLFLTRNENCRTAHVDRYSKVRR